MTDDDRLKNDDDPGGPAPDPSFSERIRPLVRSEINQALRSEILPTIEGLTQRVLEAVPSSDQISEMVDRRVREYAQQAQQGGDELGQQLKADAAAGGGGSSGADDDLSDSGGGGQPEEPNGSGGSESEPEPAPAKSKLVGALRSTEGRELLGVGDYLLDKLSDKFLEFSRFRAEQEDRRQGKDNPYWLIQQLHRYPEMAQFAAQRFWAPDPLAPQLPGILAQNSAQTMQQAHRARLDGAIKSLEAMGFEVKAKGDGGQQTGPGTPGHTPPGSTGDGSAPSAPVSPGGSGPPGTGSGAPGPSGGGSGGRVARLTSLRRPW